MRNTEFRQLKTDKGQIGICLGMFMVLFLVVILMFQFQLEQFRTSSDYMEDAIAAAGLAAALIDVREYGRTHIVKIEDPELAYETYCTALRANLGLDNGWRGKNRKLISDCVKVENFTIYNVSGNKVRILRMDQGKTEETRGILGEVYAPNGQKIERTGIYNEISYPVEGLWGIKVQAGKGKLVDIMASQEEKE